MSVFAFADVLRATGAELLAGDPARPVDGVSTDTRALERGALFVALSGPSFDGNAFAADAVARGAAGLLLRSGADPSSLALPDGLPLAVVDDTRDALSRLGAWHRGRLVVPVVGITGSCGKTSTKNMLVELCSRDLRVVGSPASYNNAIGVPLTLLTADERTSALVVEMGTNAPGEIAALCRVARPTAGIITNVGAAHLEGLGSLEGVAREKGALAEAVDPDGFVVLNADCRWTPMLRRLARARVVTFSIDGEGDLDARDVWFHSGGTTFRLCRRSDGLEREVTLPLLGLHTVQNLLAALAACEGLGIDLDRVLPGVARLRDGRRRMERVELEGLTLFDDSYNANPRSAQASVRVLAGLHGHQRRVLILGDMHELGEWTDAGHREVGELAATSGIDLVVLVGEHVRAAAVGALAGGLAQQAVVWHQRIDEALEAVPGLLRAGDVVLVKGSRAAGMDRVAERIAEEFAPAETAAQADEEQEEALQP